MNHIYQLVFLGKEEKYKELIIEQLYKQIEQLGICISSIKIIDRFNFDKEYQANNPTYCLYFGSLDKSRDQCFIKKLIQDATLILPIVTRLDDVSISIPDLLKEINAFELNNKGCISSLISCILEGFSLLREARRLFISYKRSESSDVAIQLYEALEKSGFDVFLDTHSVRPGEPFQEELWHRMTDSDVVILLNTPDFLGSEWTQEELAKANAMSIGVIQLIWPGCNPLGESHLFQSILLDSSSLDCNGKLIDSIVSQVIVETESLRARTLAARQDNLTSEFISISNYVGIESVLHTDKFITFKIQDTNYVVIPSVGVPQSFTSNNILELRKNIQKNSVEKIYLLYDHTNIRKKWLEHLNWLDLYLPVKTLKLIEIKDKLESKINKKKRLN